MSTTDIVIYFTINSEEEFEVGTEQDEAETRFEENISSSGGRRTYRVEITDVELPEDEPVTVRVSMKSGKVDSSPAHVGEAGCFPAVDEDYRPIRD